MLSCRAATLFFASVHDGLRRLLRLSPRLFIPRPPWLFRFAAFVRAQCACFFCASALRESVGVSRHFFHAPRHDVIETYWHATVDDVDEGRQLFFMPSYTMFSAACCHAAAAFFVLLLRYYFAPAIMLYSAIVIMIRDSFYEIHCRRPPICLLIIHDYSAPPPPLFTLPPITIIDTRQLISATLPPRLAVALPPLSSPVCVWDTERGHSRAALQRFARHILPRRPCLSSRTPARYMPHVPVLRRCLMSPFR